MTLEEKLEKIQQHFKDTKPRTFGVLFGVRSHPEYDKYIIFNTTNEDTDTTFSIRKLYMCFLEDPTEVAFTDAVLNGRYDFLETFKTSITFKDFYKSVRAEAEQRRIAGNIKEIVKISKDENNKQRLDALKYLTNNTFTAVEGEVKRGRPSKAEKEGAMKLALKEMSEDEQDLARLLQ